MKLVLLGGVAVSTFVSLPVLAAPSVDTLLCKRMENNFSAPAVEVVSINADDSTTATSADGSRAIKSAPEGKHGFLIADTRTGKTRAAHSRSSSYDCDLALTDDGTLNSLRWVGNDVVFAQGWFCEEFDAKPYLVNAKTGKFIAFLKTPKVTPEAAYRFAPLDASRWAISVFEHNTGEAAVLVVDVKTGKVKATKKVAGAELAKLPVCTSK